jgi:hypothetical protein
MKTDPRVTGLEVVDWIIVVQDRDRFGRCGWIEIDVD